MKFNVRKIFGILSENKLSASFEVPEPTRSLIFITDEDFSKRENPFLISIGSDSNRGGLYSEPSLIWTKLPVKNNSDLEINAMYFPTYVNLSPEQRYQYINWLRNVEQETNLSYVFLYYYGLERHLLVGNYDMAVDEILRLLKFHDKGSFRSYATTALIASSVYRKKTNILNKAPFVLEEMSNICLYLRHIFQKEFVAKDLISMASRVKFYNKRYIKLKPALFEEILQKNINDYHNKNGFILDQITDFEFSNQTYFANISIPHQARNIKTPQIIENKKFKQIIYNLLTQTHQKVKELSKKLK